MSQQVVFQSETLSAFGALKGSISLIQQKMLDSAYEGHISGHNPNRVAQNTVPVQLFYQPLSHDSTTLVQAAAATHPQAVVTKVPGVIHHQQPQQQLTNSITLNSSKLHLPNQSHTFALVGN
ncbi:unnamed protein product [Ceratitis capitata]|uniref:(Mediterranean fruit fly) hypothetical protein n=1 Tax=Ceratitis capitata TaxID=7213 RepID=A0A811UU67_CERCA|nr:unnamed protein product [Ceratitis capitata]